MTGTWKHSWWRDPINFNEGSKKMFNYLKNNSGFFSAWLGLVLWNLQSILMNFSTRLTSVNIIRLLLKNHNESKLKPLP